MNTLRKLNAKIGFLFTVAVAVAAVAQLAHASEPAQVDQARLVAQAAQPDNSTVPAQKPLVLNPENQVSPDDVARSAAFCVWEYRYVCNPYTGYCIWKYVYVCF